MTRKGGTKKAAGKRKHPREDSTSAARANGQSRRFPYDAVALVYALGLGGMVAAMSPDIAQSPPTSFRDVEKREDEFAQIFELVLPQAASLAAWVPKFHEILESKDAEGKVFAAYFMARLMRGAIKGKIGKELHKEVWTEVWRVVDGKEALKAQRKAATRTEPYMVWQSNTQKKVAANFRTLVRSSVPIILRKAEKIKGRIAPWLLASRLCTQS
jgi:hypothetical protein